MFSKNNWVENCGMRQLLRSGSRGHGLGSSGRKINATEDSAGDTALGQMLVTRPGRSSLGWLSSF